MAAAADAVTAEAEGDLAEDGGITRGVIGRQSEDYTPAWARVATGVEGSQEMKAVWMVKFTERMPIFARSEAKQICSWLQQCSNSALALL